jgi:hypothetical protein
VDGHGVMEETPGGQLYLTGIKFSFKLKDLNVDLKNLFNGNEILSELRKSASCNCTSDLINLSIGKILQIFLTHFYLSKQNHTS